MINRVVLVGRLTKDPELRHTPAGVAVARFTVAVNRPFSNQQGEKETDFILCVAWRKQAENMASYLKKGSLVGIDGRIQTGSYEKDGQRVYTTEVVADSVQFLEPRGAQSDRSQQYGQESAPFGGSQGYPSSPQQSAPPSGAGSYGRQDDDPFADLSSPGSKKQINISDDDLPF